jgi:uncharacterized protein YjbI with pentapeptide repeats
MADIGAIVSSIDSTVNSGGEDIQSTLIRMQKDLNFYLNNLNSTNVKSLDTNLTTIKSTNGETILDGCMIRMYTSTSTSPRLLMGYDSSGGNFLFTLYDSLGNATIYLDSTGKAVFAGILATTISASSITTGTLDGITITGNTITGNTISGNTISGGTISGTTITGTTISGNTINGGNIYSAYISGNTIYGGTIQGTTITGTSINGNSISGGSISGTYISGGTIYGNTISGGSISSTTISGSTMNGGTISGGYISGGTIYGSLITAQQISSQSWDFGSSTVNHLKAQYLVNSSSYAGHNHGIPDGTVLVKSGGGTATFVTSGGHYHFVESG